MEFNKYFDYLIFENILYAINNNFEFIFNLEHTNKKICNKYIDTIESLNLIADID